MKSYSLKTLGLFSALENSNPLLPDLMKMVEVVQELLKSKQNEILFRNKTQERIAKLESDLKVSLKKVERLEDQVQDREKKLGELENQMSSTAGSLKSLPKKSKQEIPEKGKVSKVHVGNLFEVEAKKKDLEIAKLKETLKKTSALHKDKIESQTKYSRFEINNFYEGIEKDYNIFDSKKTEIYKAMIDESGELRNFIFQLYSQVHILLQNSRLKSKPEHLLTWSMLNKPFAYVRDEIQILFLSLFNELKCLLSPTN